MGGLYPSEYKGGADMIHQDKIKIMTQIALYEKKNGKKDLAMYSFHREDYIGWQALKTFFAVTAAYVLIIGLIVLWNLEVIISHFDTFDYRQIIILAVTGYLCVLLFYLKITVTGSRDRYNEMRPRVRRYFRGLKKMKSFYAEEDKVQKQFEKGQWRDGQ